MPRALEHAPCPAIGRWGGNVTILQVDPKTEGRCNLLTGVRLESTPKSTDVSWTTELHTSPDHSAVFLWLGSFPLPEVKPESGKPANDRERPV